MELDAQMTTNNMGRKHTSKTPKSKEFITSSSSDTDIDEVVNYIEGNLKNAVLHDQNKKTDKPAKKRGSKSKRQAKRPSRDGHDANPKDAVSATTTAPAAVDER